MKMSAALTIAAGVALTFGVQAWSADAAPMPGKALVEAKCTGCHKSEVYTSQTRKVVTLDGLKKQVAACSDAAKTGWTEAQKDEVVSYLNTEFYKFK
jgi:cytochrome c553